MFHSKQGSALPNRPQEERRASKTQLSPSLFSSLSLLPLPRFSFLNLQQDETAWYHTTRNTELSRTIQFRMCRTTSAMDQNSSNFQNETLTRNQKREMRGKERGGGGQGKKKERNSLRIPLEALQRPWVSVQLKQELWHMFLFLFWMDQAKLATIIFPFFKFPLKSATPGSCRLLLVPPKQK